VSYFTPPVLLEQLYGRLWSAGRPVSLSVIPQHFDSVVVAYRSPEEAPDENIPSYAFGQGRSWPVGDNRPLTSLLTDLARAGHVELCLHGYQHRKQEFDVGADVARRRLRGALRAFEESFPGMTPRTFVPPYEALSRGTLAALREHRLDLATCAATARGLGLTSDAEAQDWILTTDEGMMVFACREYLFEPLAADVSVERAIEKVLATRPGVLIVTNHYWDFFRDFAEPRPERLRIWSDFLDRLLEDGAEFTTFAQEAHRRREAAARPGSSRDAPG
jgi:peptidoglycan/xylan/chitin deacetylase (PgdA/CDA1 family)